AVTWQRNNDFFARAFTLSSWKRCHPTVGRPENFSFGLRSRHPAMGGAHDLWLPRRSLPSSVYARSKRATRIGSSDVIEKRLLWRSNCRPPALLPCSDHPARVTRLSFEP